MRQSEGARLSPLWLGAGIAALIALVTLGVVSGRALVTSGLLALFGALAFDEGEVFRLAPFDTALIALDLMPWLELGGCALALGVLGISLRRIATTSGRPPLIAARESVGA
jgi:hypothetical protein